MKLLTLSLITTEFAHIRLITETKADATKLINSSSLFCENTGEYEALEQQLEIKENEINLFEKYRDAKFNKIDDNAEWKYKDLIPFKMKITDKSDTEHKENMLMEHRVIKGDNFDSLDNFEDDNFDDFSDFGNIDVSITSDDY